MQATSTDLLLYVENHWVTYAMRNSGKKIIRLEYTAMNEFRVVVHFDTVWTGTDADEACRIYNSTK